jgi:hypothetical protein
MWASRGGRPVVLNGAVGGGVQVKLPALLVETTAGEVLRADGAAMRLIDEAVTGGATGVVLRDSEGQVSAIHRNTKRQRGREPDGAYIYKKTAVRLK